jgi:hypothetical protein
VIHQDWNTGRLYSTAASDASFPHHAKSPPHKQPSHGNICDDQTERRARYYINVDQIAYLIQGSGLGSVTTIVFTDSHQFL